VYAWELIRQFFFDLKTRKLRVFLAVSGIAWGTLSVILLLAIGNAFHRASNKAMHGMGDDIVIMWTTRTTKPFAGMKPGRAIEMKADDIIQMGRDVAEIGAVSPELTHGGRTVRLGGHRVKAPVAGVVPEYEIMRNMIPVPGGRFIDPLDVKYRRRVIFLGNEVRDKLFGDEEAVGRTVFVDGRPFTVIGTLAEKLQTSNYSGPDSDRTYIPYTTFIAVWGNWNVSNTLLVPALEGDAEPMKRAVYEYMGKKLRFDPTDEGALMMWDTVEMDKFMNWFFWGLQALMGLGGALTLGAGGIGVANIMFLIVRERTREIGVRMAVGAKDWHIMGQVLLEAVLIVALGGLGGFVTSAAVIGILSMVELPDWISQPELAPAVAVVTVGILALVGLAAGLFPARRASRMDPVQALEF
jgi:putative ABC transport system permease protein